GRRRSVTHSTGWSPAGAPGANRGRRGSRPRHRRRCHWPASVWRGAAGTAGPFAVAPWPGRARRHSYRHPVVTRDAGDAFRVALSEHLELPALRVPVHLTEHHRRLGAETAGKVLG